MTEDHFSGVVADTYDATLGELGTASAVEPVVGVLAGLAGDGAALELALGTGRIALPLQARGVPVSGIELSEDMVARFRAKPGAEHIEVAVGDMADTTVAGGFSVVYLVFNTIMNLTTQEAQVACIANAAAHLDPGGHFVVEVIVPPLRRLPPGEQACVFDLSDAHVGVDDYDPVDQTARSHHFVREADGRYRRHTMPFRYVWPSELDLMARMAGMHLVDRWADWTGTPFTADSGAHVSVWRRA